MDFKYRLGQKVMVVDRGEKWPPEAHHLIGLVGIVLEKAQDVKDTDRWKIINGPCYRIDGSDGWFIAEGCLRPLNDGDNAGNWNECAWRPNLEHPVVPLPSRSIKETA